jgi:hypothetical protein
MFQDFQLNFDATQFDPRQSEGGVCLPLADYPMEITNIAQVAKKDDPNKGYLEISLTVLDGQYKGQVQKDRLNVYGQDDTTTRIGYQRLSAYAHIAGKVKLPNAGMLLGTKLIATCGPQNPPNEKYSEVKMVKDIAGNPPVLGQPAAPQPANGQAFGQQPQQPVFGQPAQGQPQQPQQPAQGGWNNPAQQPAQPAQPAQAGFGVQNLPMQGQPAQPAWNQSAQPAASGNTPSWAK